jgi:hypothetical protein
MMGSTRRLLREIDSLRAWVADDFNRELLYAEAVEEVEGHLDNPRSDSLAVIGSNFLNIESWLGASAAAKILEGEDGEWAELRRALHYKSWAVRALLHLYKVDERTKKQPRIRALHASLALAHALAIGDESISAQCRDALLYASGKGGLAGFGESALDIFILELSSLPGSISSDWKSLGVSFGPYQAVLDSWGADDRAFCSALIDACDYHMKKTQEVEGSLAEFAQYPYNVFPAEVLATIEVRKVAGVGFEGIDHPLMRTPLARLPDTLATFSDMLLERAESFLAEAVS